MSQLYPQTMLKMAWILRKFNIVLSQAMFRFWSRTFFSFFCKKLQKNELNSQFIHDTCLNVSHFFLHVVLPKTRSLQRHQNATLFSHTLKFGYGLKSLFLTLRKRLENRSTVHYFNIIGHIVCRFFPQKELQSASFLDKQDKTDILDAH